MPRRAQCAGETAPQALPTTDWRVGPRAFGPVQAATQPAVMHTVCACARVRVCYPHPGPHHPNLGLEAASVARVAPRTRRRRAQQHVAGRQVAVQDVARVKIRQGGCNLLQAAGPGQAAAVGGPSTAGRSQQHGAHPDATGLRAMLV